MDSEKLSNLPKDGTVHSLTSSVSISVCEGRCVCVGVCVCPGGGGKEEVMYQVRMCSRPWSSVSCPADHAIYQLSSGVCRISW